MTILNGVSVICWVLNLAIGQNGNLIHKVFYFVASAMRIAPLLPLYHAMFIQRQYLANGSAYDKEVDLAGDVANEVLYLYDPDETNEMSPHHIDYDTYHNAIFGLHLVGLITLVAQNVAVAGIKADWTLQNAAWKLENGSEDEEEEVTEEEPAF
jgi:hypothetical protein